MVHLKSIWESIDGRFGVHKGYVLVSIWDPFGVCVGSILRSGSDSVPRPPRDKISRPLGPILVLSWTPCWPHVGSMLQAVGRLEASLGVSGPI